MTSSLVYALFYLVCGVAASSENTDRGLCDQYFTNFQPKIGGLIEYRVLLDQAITGIQFKCRVKCLACEIAFSMVPSICLHGTFIFSSSHVHGLMIFFFFSCDMLNEFFFSDESKY